MALQYDKIFNPEVVKQFTDEMLNTYLAVEGHCEVDNSLQSQAGDTVHIWRYSDEGEAQKVAYNEGNTEYSDVVGRDYKFTVAVCQDRVRINDEDIQRAPYVVNAKMEVPAKHIINALRSDVINAWYSTNNAYVVTSASGLPTIEELILSQNNLDLGLDGGMNGNGETPILFLNPKDHRKFQTYLVQNNVIVAAEIINGKKYNTAAGIAFSASDLVAEGSPIFATNKAVRLLKAPCVSTEADRDANKRATDYYNRQYYVAGLEFSKKALIFGTELTAEFTAPTNGTYKINGVADDASTVANANIVIGDITPAVGYELDTVTVTGTAGTYVPVKIDDKTWECKMQNEDVTVAVTFKAI